MTDLEVNFIKILMVAAGELHPGNEIEKKLELYSAVSPFGDVNV